MASERRGTWCSVDPGGIVEEVNGNCGNELIKFGGAKKKSVVCVFGRACAWVGVSRECSR